MMMADGEAKYARMFDIKTRLKSLSRDDFDTEEIAKAALDRINELEDQLEEFEDQLDELEDQLDEQQVEITDLCNESEMWKTRYEMTQARRRSLVRRSK